MSNEGDWRNKIPYPYEGLNDPKYIKARDKLFAGNNGWWWGNGWWSDEQKETPMEYNRRKRKERGD
jgi:hypothetical protein